MSALAAIAIFPVLIMLLVALTKAEHMLGNLAEEPAASPVPGPLRLPVPQPQLRLIEAEERLAA